MKTKITLPKELADAIDYERSVGLTNMDIVATALRDGELVHKHRLALRKFAQDNFELFLKALVNGYEVEQAPEDRVRDLYSRQKIRAIESADNYSVGYTDAIHDVLTVYNIKIEGVNA